MAVPIISSRIFIPAKKINYDTLKKHYTFAEYKESACQRCPIFRAGDRPSPNCMPCDNYIGTTEMWKEIKFDNIRYYALPPGQPKLVAKNLKVNLSNAKDIRPIISLTYPIKFTGKLRDGSILQGRPTVNQIKVVEEWMAKKSGIVKCPPRSGKTTIATYIVCKLGVKRL